MSTPTLERRLRVLPATTPPVTWTDRPERVSLRTDLYLLAHDDDTGRPHLDTETVAVGLAGAVLLELWHAGRVHLERETRRHGRRKPEQVTLIDAAATGDPINDAALTLLWRMGGTTNTRRFIEEFATTSDLYQQVRDHLTGSGILRTVTRRRYWLFRTQIRRPANATHPVRARMRIRDVARLYKPHPHDTTLAALVTALRLTRHLNHTDTSVTSVHIRLAELVSPEHPIHDITNAIRPHRTRHP